MRIPRIWVSVGLIFVVAVAAMGSVNWQETAAGTQFRVNPRTGETQIGFYVALQYDSVPKCILLDVHWTVYHGEELLAEDHHRGTKHCGGKIQSVSTLSPFITPMPGESYQAKIVLTDTANDISYARTISYTAPLSFPTGIGINVKTPSGETHEVDWSDVSDDDVKKLATYFSEFTADYVQTASATTISDFAVQYAADDDAYPVWVWILATIGPKITGQGDGISIHATYNRLLFFYRVPSAEALNGVLDQLKGFNQEFRGWVLARKAGEGPVYVFIDNRAREMLSSAADEAKRRGLN